MRKPITLVRIDTTINGEPRLVEITWDADAGMWTDSRLLYWSARAVLDTYPPRDRRAEPMLYESLQQMDPAYDNGMGA